MKVFLTGSTGFVGAHTATEMLRGGHSLRLLVRDAGLAERYFRERGETTPELVVGDMRDASLVSDAMRGCDAVVHAAALVSLDQRRAEEIERTNLEGMRSVVGGAHARGIPNIVYVSSLGALFRPGGPQVDERSPLGDSREAYARSKRLCEAYARDLQEQGAPLQITYPSGVFGPDDPRLSESSHGLMAMLRIVPRTSTGIQCVDVRDLARAHRLLVEATPRRDPIGDRYVVAGHYHAWSDFRDLLEGITGRSIPSPVVHGAILRWLGRMTDRLRAMIPIDFPISAESMDIVTRWTVADSGHLERSFGFAFRPGRETLADAIASLHLAGHISRRTAGALARKDR